MTWDSRIVSPEELNVLDRLATPMWIYDPDTQVRHWANTSALRLWGAESLEALLANEAPLVSTEATERRLQAVIAALARGESCVERWTFYPDGGEAFTADCTFNTVRIPAGNSSHGKRALLIEAHSLESEVSAAERRSIEALRHTEVMVTLYDDAWQPLVRNPSAIAAFGNGPAQLCAPDSIATPHVRQALEAAARSRQPYAAVADVHTLNGRQTHQIDARPTLDPATGAPCILLSQTDRTAEEEARKANESKRVFLTNMSHELRTPLNAIVGYTELALESAREQHLTWGEEDLGHVLKSAHHLTALIDDLLDISTIEAGRLELDMQTVPLEPLVRDCTSWMCPGLNAHHNTVTVNGPQVIVHADPVRLRQVLLKLLSNACNFTRDGRITVQWQVADGAVDIQVMDTGCGIPEEARPFLFEPFTQADQSPTRRVGGAGLGLAIAGQLASAMGGELTLAHTDSSGSTFDLRLKSASD